MEATMQTLACLHTLKALLAAILTAVSFSFLS